MENEESAQKVDQSSQQAVSIDVQKTKEACTDISIPGFQKEPTQQGPTGSRTPVSHSSVTKKNHCAIAEQQRIVHCIEELDNSIDKTRDHIKYLESKKVEIEVRLNANEKVDNEKKQATAVQLSFKLQCWQKIYIDNQRTQQSTQKALDDLGASEHTTSEFSLYKHPHDTPVYQESTTKHSQFLQNALRQRIVMDKEQEKKELSADLEKRKQAELERHQQNQAALAKVTDEYYAIPENRQKERENREFFTQTFYKKSKPQGSEASERQRRVDERMKRRGEVLKDATVDESPLDPNASKAREESRKCNYIAVDNIPLLLTAEERARDVPFYQRPEYEREVGMTALQPKLVEDPKKVIDNHINYWRSLPQETMDKFKKSFGTHGRNFPAVAKDVFGDEKMSPQIVHLFYVTKRLKDDSNGVKDIYRDVKKKEAIRKRNCEKVVTRSQKKPSQASMRVQIDGEGGRNEKKIRATQQASTSYASTKTVSARTMADQKAKSTRMLPYLARSTRSRTEERQWSQFEIKILKEILRIHGAQFNLISDAIGSKTYRQCERYYFNNQHELEPLVRKSNKDSEKGLLTKRKRKVIPRQTTPCSSPTKKQVKSNKQDSSFPSARSSKNEENPFGVCSKLLDSIMATESNQPAPSNAAGIAFNNTTQEGEATTSSFSFSPHKPKPPAVVKKSYQDDNEHDKIAQTSLVSLPQHEQTKFSLPPSSSSGGVATKSTNETFNQPSFPSLNLTPERSTPKRYGTPKKARMTMPVEPQVKSISSCNEDATSDATSSPDNNIQALRLTRSRARKTSLNSNNSNNLLDADVPPLKQAKVRLALRKLRTDLQFHESKTNKPKAPNYCEDDHDIDDDDTDSYDNDDDEDYNDRRIKQWRAPIKMTIKTTKSGRVSESLSSSLVASVASENESSPSLKRSDSLLPQKEEGTSVNRKGKVKKPRQTTPIKPTTPKLVNENDDKPATCTNIEGSDAIPKTSSINKSMLSLEKFSPSVGTINKESNSTLSTSQLSAPTALQQPRQDDTDDAGLSTENNVVEPLLLSEAADTMEIDAADVELDYPVKPSPIKSPLTPEEPAEIMEVIGSPVPAHNNSNETNSDDKIRPPFPSPSPSPETIAAAPPKISDNYEPAPHAILVSPKHASEALSSDDATIARQKVAVKVAAVVTPDPVQEKSAVDTVAPVSVQQYAAADVTKDMDISPNIDDFDPMPYQSYEYDDPDFYPQYDPSGDSGSEPCFTPPPQTDYQDEFDGALETCDSTLLQQQTPASSDVPSASGPPLVSSPSRSSVICEPQQGADKISLQAVGSDGTRPNTLVDKFALSPKVASFTCPEFNVADESASATPPPTVEMLKLLHKEKTKSVPPTCAQVTDVTRALPPQTSQPSIPATQPLNLSMKKDYSSSNDTSKKVASDLNEIKLKATPSHSTNKITCEDSEKTKNIAARKVNMELGVVISNAPPEKNDKSVPRATLCPSDTAIYPPPPPAPAAESLKSCDLSSIQRQHYNYHKHKIHLAPVSNPNKVKSVVATASSLNKKEKTTTASAIPRRITTAKRPGLCHTPPTPSVRPPVLPTHLRPHQQRPHAPFSYRGAPWPMNSFPSHFNNNPMASLQYIPLAAPAPEPPPRHSPPQRCATPTKKDDVVFIDLTTTTAAEAQKTATTTDATAAPSSSNATTFVEHILNSVMRDYMVGGGLRLQSERQTYYPSFQHASHHQQHLQEVSAQNLPHILPHQHDKYLDDLYAYERQRFQWQIEQHRHVSVAMAQKQSTETAVRPYIHHLNQRSFEPELNPRSGITWQHQPRTPLQFHGQRAHHHAMLRQPNPYHLHNHHHKQQTYVPTTITTNRAAPRPFIPPPTSVRRGVERPSNQSILFPRPVAPLQQPPLIRYPQQQHFQDHFIRPDVQVTGPTADGGGVRQKNLKPVQTCETARRPNFFQNEMYSALHLRTKITEPKQQSRASKPAENLHQARANLSAANKKDQPLMKSDYNPVYEPISDDEFVPSTITNNKI